MVECVFLGWASAKERVKVSCSKTQHSDSANGETRTSNPSIHSLTPYQLIHCAPLSLWDEFFLFTWAGSNQFSKNNIGFRKSYMHRALVRWNNGLLTSSRMGMTSKRQSKAVLLSAAILSTLYIENIQSLTGNQTNKQNIRMENYIYNQTNYQLFTGKWLEFRESSRAFFNLWHGNYIFKPIIEIEWNIWKRNL